jgi:DNA-binding GntR family transcriptional regulator
MKIQRNIPLSEKIYSVIKERIINGEYVSSSQIPSELELTEEFGISRSTVRTALATLVFEGLLIRKPGLGTFVATNNRLESGIEILESVTTMAKRQGLMPGFANLQIEEIFADSYIAENLQIPIQTKVINVNRAILVNNERVSYQEDYIHPKWLEKADIDDSFAGSVLDVLQKNHRASIDRAITEFTAVLPTPKIQEMLEIKKNSPLITLKETLYSLDGSVMCYSDNFFIPGRIYWQVVRRFT